MLPKKQGNKKKSGVEARGEGGSKFEKREVGNIGGSS